MLVSTKGIVLHRIKYADTSLIVNIFTEDFGTRSFMVKNAFSKKNKINYSHFVPLTLLDITFYDKKTDILFLKEVSFRFPFRHTVFDPSRHSILVFYSEILYKTLYHYGEDRHLYQYLEKSIRELDTENTPPPDTHIRFMLKLAQCLGFVPENNYSEKNRYFHISGSSFAPYYFDNGEFLPGDASLYLKTLLENMDTPAERLPSKIIRNRLLHAMVRYFEIHIEGIKKIESIEIMAQILN